MKHVAAQENVTAVSNSSDIIHVRIVCQQGRLWNR
jgi:hypothetical protein